MDRKGSGIQRIMTTFSDCEKKPTFTSEASSFFVVLPNMTYYEEQKNGDKKSAIKNGDKKSAIKRKTRENLNKILACMEANTSYTTATIANLIELQPSRTRQLLRMLVDTGRISCTGNKKNRMYKKG